jgi:isoamylase
VEGPTDDPAVNALRLRQQRNFLTTLMLSQGVPMLAHGDELGRTQLGNNNVYAQDSELSWIDWDLDTDERALLAYTSSLIQLRKNHPVFRRRRFFVGDAAHGGESELGDIEWFSSDGTLMDESDWSGGFARTLMVFLNGDAIPEPDALGRRITDDHFLMMFNAHSDPVDFCVPPPAYGLDWTVRLASSVTDRSEMDELSWKAGSVHSVESHSVVILSTTSVPEEEKAASRSRAQKAASGMARASARKG